MDVSKNGDIVTFGCFTTEFNTSLRGYIRKMDDSGSLIWDRIFERDLVKGYPRFFRAGLVLTNGRIIAAGPGSIAFSDSNAHNAPWVVILDSNGKVLSNRGYTSIFNGPLSAAEFEDIRPTVDGGFIAGGMYLPYAGDTGNQDMFVLKLDSAGCEYPGCQPPLGIQTPKQESVSFTVYPNPFNTGITFDVGQAEVDEIIITDIRGVLVDRIIMDDKQSKATWNSGKMAAGIYIATISITKGALSLKVIKY